jgi:hypothetical protein
VLYNLQHFQLLFSHSSSALLTLAYRSPHTANSNAVKPPVFAARCPVVEMRWEAQSSSDKAVPGLSAWGDLCVIFLPLQAVLTLTKSTAEVDLASPTRHQKRRRQDPRLCFPCPVAEMRWEAQTSSDKVAPGLSAWGDLCSDFFLFNCCSHTRRVHC